MKREPAGGEGQHGRQSARDPQRFPTGIFSGRKQITADEDAQSARAGAAHSRATATAERRGLDGRTDKRPQGARTQPNAGACARSGTLNGSLLSLARAMEALAGREETRRRRRLHQRTTPTTAVIGPREALPSITANGLGMKGVAINNPSAKRNRQLNACVIL